MTTSLRDMFVQNFGKLVFRRVASVTSVNAPCIYRKKGYDHQGVFFTMDVSESNVHTLTPAEIKQNVAEHSSNYRFTTYKTVLRSSDTYQNIIIRGLRRTKGNISDGLQMTSVLPEDVKNVMPRIDDLVAGFVEKTVSPVDGQVIYVYSRWFICSEQFFHMWTAIMEPESESLFPMPKTPPSEEDREKIIRRHLMSGNRLCTNSFLKYQLGCQQSGMSFPLEEMVKRYYHLRTESPSIKYVHLYAAAVLMVRYGETPSDKNVPNNLDRFSPKLKEWSLPERWLDITIVHFPNYAQQALYPPTPKADSEIEVSSEEVKLQKPTYNIQSNDEFPTL